MELDFEERREIDYAFSYQPPLLKVNIPPSPLPEPPPSPKEDLVFELILR